MSNITSFERTFGIIDHNVLKQNYNFSNEEKIILKNYVNEYEQIKHLLI